MRLPRSRSLAIRTRTKSAMQSLALEGELEIALRQRLLGGLRSLGLPIAAVPQHDRAAAILTLGDRPFEVAIIERMIFDLDRKPLVMRVERRPFGHSPGFENAIQLEPQIVVQAGGVVLLDDEAATGRGLDSDPGRLAPASAGSRASPCRWSACRSPSASSGRSSD